LIERELERLARGWRGFWPDADVGAMGADVRARLTTAVERWGLEGVALLGGGNVALVCTALAERRPVVLKLHPGGHGEVGFMAAESVALEAWGGSGAAPELFDLADDRLTLLMERLEPGLQLDATGVDWEERLRILGRLAARLHAHGAPTAGIPTLAEYGADWRRHLARDPALLAELDELLATTDGEALLHSDLHGGNALEHRGSWLAIDPHAVRGDPHADVWALIDPLAPALPEGAGAAPTARHLVEVYATAANLDPVRAGRWARVRAAAEAASIAADDALDADEREWGERLGRFAAALA
jgi:streptomycin 6-kinase